MRSIAAVLALASIAVLTVALGASTRSAGGAALGSAAPTSRTTPAPAASAALPIPPPPIPTPSFPTDVRRDIRAGLIDSRGPFGMWRYDGAKGILTPLALPAPSPRAFEAAPGAMPEWSVSSSGRYRIEQRQVRVNGLIANTELWLVDSLKNGPSPRLLYAPSHVPPPMGQPNPSIGPYVFQATQYAGSWSPDERYLTFWDVGMVSGSIDADGRPYLAIDVTTGSVTQLGQTLLSPGAWRAPHTLAYVSGGSRFTWSHKILRIWEPAVGTRDVTGPEEIGLAPLWDATGRIWFITATTGEYDPAPYFAGQGIGDRHVAVFDPATGRRARIASPDGYAAEGVRPSADGRVMLLLLRRTVDWHTINGPGWPTLPGILELWIADPDGSAPNALMKFPGPPGFGYYGHFASLSTLTWTRP